MIGSVECSRTARSRDNGLCASRAKSRHQTPFTSRTGYSAVSSANSKSADLDFRSSARRDGGEKDCHFFGTRWSLNAEVSEMFPDLARFKFPSGANNVILCGVYEKWEHL